MKTRGDTTRPRSRSVGAAPAFRAMLVGALLAGASVANAAGPPSPPRRDPALAVAEEFAAAVAADSAAALILFIARHPADPSADAARRALAARARPDPGPTPGADGAVIDAFDRARRAGPSALDDFAAAHPGHPLAAESRRAIWRR